MCACDLIHDGEKYMVTFLNLANPRHACMAQARRPSGARAMLRWATALALLAAGCGGSPPSEGDPDAGTPGIDAIDPNRPDAGPPVGFEFPTPLNASDGATRNWFGYSVAASENVIVVGAPFYDVLSGDEVLDASVGAVYIYERIGDAWQETKQLLSTASVRTSGLFGWSVAIDGNVIAVGAWNESGPDGQAGAVYVYERVGGDWVLNSKLLPLSDDNQERFGHSVAVSGSRLAVGAPFISDVDDNESATPAYVFERTGASWVGTDLVPEGDPRDTWFGLSIGISGDVVVVGAPGQKERGLGVGAAYVFEYSGSSWNQTAVLEDSDGGDHDFLGRDVAVDGDVIVVGGEGGGVLNTGIALVYERSADTWVESARLLPAGVSVATQLGFSVDVRGGVIVVGAHHDDYFGTDSGAAYVFEKDVAAGWVEKSKLYNPGSTSGDHFGAAAAVAGARIVVGARYDDDDGDDSGRSYVFEPRP
jgi:hypothetical protein